MMQLLHDSSSQGLVLSRGESTPSAARPKYLFGVITDSIFSLNPQKITRMRSLFTHSTTTGNPNCYHLLPRSPPQPPLWPPCFCPCLSPTYFQYRSKKNNVNPTVLSHWVTSIPFSVKAKALTVAPQPSMIWSPHCRKFHLLFLSSPDSSHFGLLALLQTLKAPSAVHCPFSCNAFPLRCL